MRSGEVIAERYGLVELTGAGGMGTVWLADDPVESRQVALERPNVVTGSVIADPRQEAEVALRIAHPNAVRVFGVVDEGWLVMEYFPATSLAHLLHRRLSPSRVAAVEGTPPFGTGDPDVVLARIRDGHREPFRQAGPLAPVLATLMARDRAARPSASQAAEWLEAVASGQPLPDRVPAAPRARPR